MSASIKDVMYLRGPRRRLRRWRRERSFDRAMREYLSDPHAACEPGNNLIGRLIQGWNNSGYSAWEEFMVAALKAAQTTPGPILECGSGLSTLLIGVVADRRGNAVWSLEDHPDWAGRVRSALDRYGVRSVRLDHAPLKNYGDYSWYQPSFDGLDEKFSLVLCDGPPGDTPGGRYGFLPVMRPRLADGCTVILDDAERDEERVVARRWAQELEASFEVHGVDKPYIELQVPAARATPGL